MQLDLPLLAFCCCSLRVFVVDGGSRGGCIFKVAFGTNPHGGIFRLMRQMKVERMKMNICFETKDTTVLFLRYLGSTAMVITTEIRRDKKRDRFSSLNKPHFNKAKLFDIMIYS